MVTGMETFKHHFVGVEDSFVLIRQSLDNSGIRMTPPNLIGIMNTYFQVKT